jgi:hypothetical protein
MADPERGDASHLVSTSETHLAGHLDQTGKPSRSTHVSTYIAIVPIDRQKPDGGYNPSATSRRSRKTVRTELH